MHRNAATALVAAHCKPGMRLPALLVCVVCALNGCGSHGTQAKTTTQKEAARPGVTRYPSRKHPPTPLPIGTTGVVGALRVRPLSLVKLRRGTATVWRARIAVANEGPRWREPFCVEGTASLEDRSGGIYEGKPVVGEAGSQDCLRREPQGSRLSPFLVDFETPPRARPAMLLLWADPEYDELGQSWTVKRLGALSRGN